MPLAKLLRSGDVASGVFESDVKPSQNNPNNSEQILTELSGLLGGLVPSLFRDGSGALDFSKIPAKSFEEFLSFLKTQVAVNDGSWFSDPYVGLVGKEEYRELLSALYDLGCNAAQPSRWGAFQDSFKKFESDLIRINAEKFVQQHLSSKQGRTHLRHLLGDITHFTKSERGQVLNAIAAVSRQEHKILENHLDGIKNHTLYWGSLNVFQSDEEIAKATLGANIVLDAVEVEEEYTASREKYLEKRSTQDEQMDYMVKLSKEKAHTPIVEAEVHLAKMWLMVADEERWSALMNQDSTRENDEKSKKEWGLDSSRPSIQTNKIRKWLFEQIKNHFEWIKAIRAESDPKKAEALFEQFSKNLHNTFHGDVHLNGFSTWEITKDYIRSSTTGLTLSTLLEEIPKSQKKEFEAIFQLTDRWHYAQKYGEKIFDGSKARGIGELQEGHESLWGPDASGLSSNGPDVSGLHSRKIEKKKKDLIQALTEAHQSLWVGYAGRGTFSRSLSFFADTINSTGDKATIHKASDFIKTRIQNLEKAQTAEAIQIEIEKIYSEAQEDGILNHAFHASSSEGLEALLNLAETCMEYVVTTAATRGLGALKAAKTVKDLKAVVQTKNVVEKTTSFKQVSKWAAEAFPKAKESFKMGMLTSTEGMILQNLSDQAGREELTLQNIGIQGLSEAISMAVMGLVPEKEAAKVLFKNKIQQAIYSVARNLPRHITKESIEEISATLLQQAMKDPSQPISEEEILNTIKLCAVSGGMETKALLKAITFDSHDAQKLSNFWREEVKPVLRDMAVRTVVLGMNGGVDDAITKSIIEEAQSELTDSRRLDILAKHADESVRRKVAKNPNTSLETLLELSMLFPEEVVSNISLEIYLLSDPLLYNRLSFSVLLYLAQRLEKEDNSIKVKLIGNAILSEWYNNITISPFSMDGSIVFPVLQIKCDALLNRLILTSDLTILQTVARNFFLSEDQLSHLSNCTFHVIRALVAAHPSLGVETIRKLSGDNSLSVRTAIAMHPKISHELLECFSQDENIDVRVAVARHSNTTAEILSRLMNDPDEKVRVAVASNRNTSSTDLDLLSQDSNREVQSAADSNPGIRFERLSKISVQGRVSIAANEKNLLGLALLENDSEIEVRKALVLNPHLPLAQVIRMKEKGDLFFRQHMAAFIHLPEVLDVLGNDPDLTVRKNVISNGHTSLETLTRMSQASDSQMRRYIAIHVRFPEILDSLGNDPDPEVRKNVISNRHTSLETLTRMTKDSDLQIRRHIALHVRFPEILDILGDDLDHEVRRNVLSNAHVTLKTFRKTVLGVEPESRRYIAWQTKNNEMLAILSSDPDLEVKERVVDNKNTSLETLKRMTQDPSPKLREHIAWRSQNEEILDLLANDPDLEVKRRVVDNENTSLETLKRMTQDPDPKLRQHMEWRKK